MKYSALVAALLAMALTACGEKAETSSTAAPAAETAPVEISSPAVTEIAASMPAAADAMKK